MRPIALLACSLLLASTLARANETPAMPNYMGWMDQCYADYHAQYSLRGPVMKGDIQFIAAKCQCEYNHLPAEGRPLDDALLRATSKVCYAEYEKGMVDFIMKYFEQIKAHGIPVDKSIYP